MLWLILLVTTLLLATLGKRLWATNEVYALPLYLTVVFTGCWGVAIAPTEVKLLLGLWALSRLRAIGKQANSLLY